MTDACILTCYGLFSLKPYGGGPLDNTCKDYDPIASLKSKIN